MAASKLRKFVTAGIFIALVFMLGMFPLSAEAAESAPIKLKVVSPYPAGTFTNQMIEWYVTALEKESKGAIKFTKFWGGSLLKGRETLEGIQHGVADVALICPAYTPGKLPLAFSHYAFPFVPRSAALMSTIIEQLYKEFPFLEEEWTRYNIKAIYNGTVSDYGILSRMPLKTLKDLHGKKIAQLGGYFAAWTKASGIQPISGMTASERYERMRSGVVDGSLLTPSFFVDFKEYEVAKNCTMTGLGARVPFFVIVNLKVWNKFPPAVQKMFMEVGHQIQLKHAKATDEKMEKDLKVLQDKGVKYYGYLSTPDIKKWAEKVPNTPAQMCKSLEGKYPQIWAMAKRLIQLASENGYTWPRDFKLK